MLGAHDLCSADVLASHADDPCGGVPPGVARPRRAVPVTAAPAVPPRPRTGATPGRLSQLVNFGTLLTSPVRPGMATDRYELTMLGAALADGTADVPCVFEVFARRLPDGRRFGVVAGTARVIEAITSFRFDGDELAWMRAHDVIDQQTAAWLAGYRFTGDVDGYPEGEVWFPGSPVLTVRGTFAEAVVLETVVLSILNHDAAVAAAAARMVVAAAGRPIIEMGTRRTHEAAAIAAARAAYLAGFASTSNLAAGRECAIPTAGTAAHTFTLLYQRGSRRVPRSGGRPGAGHDPAGRHLRHRPGIDLAVAAAGPQLGAIRIDSGDLGVLAHRPAPNWMRWATSTRGSSSAAISTSTPSPRSAPPRSTCTAPAPRWSPVRAPRQRASSTSSSRSTAARRQAVRAQGDPRRRQGGPARPPPVRHGDRGDRPRGRRDDLERRAAQLVATTDGLRRLDVALIRAGVAPGGEPLTVARDRLATVLHSLPWEALALSKGEAGTGGASGVNVLVLADTHLGPGRAEHGRDAARRSTRSGGRDPPRRRHRRSVRARRARRVRPGPCRARQQRPWHSRCRCGESRRSPAAASRWSTTAASPPVAAAGCVRGSPTPTSSSSAIRTCRGSSATSATTATCSTTSTPARPPNAARAALHRRLVDARRRHRRRRAPRTRVRIGARRRCRANTSNPRRALRHPECGQSTRRTSA